MKADGGCFCRMSPKSAKKTWITPKNGTDAVTIFEID
jgi:hypothetical protein